MSKPVKELIRKELANRFEGVTSMAIVGFSGLDAVATNSIRARLRERNISLTVVKNSLAKQTFKSIGLDAAAELIEGPCAVAYGADSVVDIVRELVKIGQESPQLTVKAALLEGEMFKGDEQVKALSKYPTRDEALGQIAGCAISLGSILAACIISPASHVASLVKAVEDKGGAQAAEEAPSPAPAPAEGG